MNETAAQGEGAQEVAALQATVRGRVQGVGFRAYVFDCANNLRVRGYVRNMHDGSVQVVAVGKRGALNELLARLYRGPSMARVSAVDHVWLKAPPEVSPHYFEVRG